MSDSALNGRLRDLAMTEVLQLLSLGRKSGSLRVEAPIYGRRARVRFVQGNITDARVWTVDEVEPVAARTTPADGQDVQRHVYEILEWRDGQFRFEASTPVGTAPIGASGERVAQADASSVRLAVDPILVEAARRAEQWARIADRVPHPGVIPAFVDGTSTSLPLLRLSPSQWEVLTRVDGQRDLMGLAAALDRDVIEIASLVHEMLAAGVLTIRDVVKVPRRNPTPPAVFAIPDPVSKTPIPRPVSFVPPQEPEEDSLFDPDVYGVRFDGRAAPTPSSWPVVPPVASTPVAPSIAQEQEPVTPPEWHGPALCRFGDDLARRGDLRGALAYWHAALRAMVPVADPGRVREAIALVTRLLALLQS